MTAAERMHQIREQMLADGNSVSFVELGGGVALVGYQSKFRWRWFATKLHLFTVVLAVPEATSEQLSVHTQQAVDYAMATKGKLRGLQVGIAVIPALASEAVPADARQAVEARPPKKWSAFVFPAIVDLTTNETHWYRGRILWGRLYDRWLRTRLERVLVVNDPGR